MRLRKVASISLCVWEAALRRSIKKDSASSMNRIKPLRDAAAHRNTLQIKLLSKSGKILKTSVEDR